MLLDKFVQTLVYSLHILIKNAQSKFLTVNKEKTMKARIKKATAVRTSGVG